MNMLVILSGGNPAAEFISLLAYEEMNSLGSLSCKKYITYNF